MSTTCYTLSSLRSEINALQNAFNISQYAFAKFTATSPLSYNRTTGVLSIGSVTGATPAIIGTSGDGGASDPVNGESVYQNDDLIGVGSTNSGLIQIFINDVPSIITNDFEEGEIDISPNTFQDGDVLYINTNQ